MYRYEINYQDCRSKNHYITIFAESENEAKYRLENEYNDYWELIWINEHVR